MKCPRCQKAINPDDPTVDYLDGFYVHIDCLIEACREFRFSRDEKNLLAGSLDNYEEQELFSEKLGMSREELLEWISEMIK